MAECSLASLRGQCRGRWTQSNSKLYSRSFAIGMPKRGYAHKIHLPFQSRAAIQWKSAAYSHLSFHGRGHRVETLAKCFRLQSLMDSESIVSPYLMLFSDEALLTISMFFAYLAGVIPSGQTSPAARNNGVHQHITEPSSSDSGRDLKSLPETNAGFDPSDMWSEVRAKLSEALQANVQDASLNNREDDLKSDRKNYPLSMLAIHGGPRLRLLLITFQLLEMEARGTSQLSD
nr:unnamed protein product [Digitaria exilis]